MLMFIVFSLSCRSKVLCKFLNEVTNCLFIDDNMESVKLICNNGNGTSYGFNKTNVDLNEKRSIFNEKIASLSKKNFDFDQ